MPADIDLQDVENATKQLLDGRMDSVRNLARARAHIAAKEDELRQAEAADKAAYDAALKAGWTATELRKIGLGSSTKKTRNATGRSRTRQQTEPTPSRAAAEAVPA